MTRPPLPEPDCITEMGVEYHSSNLIHAYADACVQAETAELKRWKSTNAPRLEALQGLLEHAQIEAAKGAEAIASLESERAANTILTDETAALRERVRVLEDALRGVLPWVVTEEVACNGLKCREAVCMSCDSDSKANAQLACDAYCVAHAALNKEKT